MYLLHKISTKPKLRESCFFERARFPYTTQKNTRSRVLLLYLDFQGKEKRKNTEPTTTWQFLLGFGRMFHDNTYGPPSPPTTTWTSIVVVVPPPLMMVLTWLLLPNPPSPPPPPSTAALVLVVGVANNMLWLILGVLPPMTTRQLSHWHNEPLLLLLSLLWRMFLQWQPLGWESLLLLMLSF